MGEEKREHARVSFQSELEVVFGGQTIEGLGINLAIGGLSFSAPQRFQPGDSVGVRFRVGERKFSLNAVVRHSTKVIEEITGVDRFANYVVGVQFGVLSPSDQSLLSSALHELHQLYGED
jgi:hypothetical protein